MNPVKLSIPPVLFLLLLQFCTCSIYHDSITQHQPIRDGDTLISSGQVFALGFFSPTRSSRRFVGIWYNKVSVQTLVWVANRDNPVSNGSGVLSVTPQGNLVLLGENDTVWSSNASSTTSPYPTARLLDSGNLVLLKNDNTTVIWQSFDHPTDTFLPSMKLGVDRRTGLNRVYSSWISEDDPGTGNYSYAVDPAGYPQVFLYKGQDPWWRVGSWTGAKFTGVPEMTSNFIFTATFVNNPDEIYALYGVRNESILTRMVVESSGFVSRSTWNDQTEKWIKFWYDPKEPCDYYKECGMYSVCDPSNAESFHCKCLPGFRPKSAREWDLRDGSGGCVRIEGPSVCGSGEGFVKMANVKLPDTKLARVDMSLSLEACEKECERNCSCKAYANADERGTGCMTWHGDLVDARKYSDMGQDLYVRVDSVTLAKENDKASSRRRWMLPLFIFIALFMALLLIFGCWRLSRKPRGSASGRKMKHSLSSMSESCRNEDVATFFDLASIAAATDNFSFANKLGQGGFGPVYKGQMADGKDIAVKRLSKSSGQGTEEFKNEVSLIAKLQHRNLVRILGYCIQGEEKMLIYEYLPNKSLDFFLFDEAKRSLLDWKKRFNIVHGVARGILYLHQDSRLRIIHRDLKASNVLLDAAMNPKISDFGMARIFGGDQIQGCTRRVVGTYGYMAPEYAMGGLFSIKSDVYSFGVMLLELVTGKRNSGYYHESWPSNLIGHVWELWNEGRALELVDERMEGSYERDEAMRCIQIGLLCVQECAGDRPTMSAVVFMLGNNDITYRLPSPSQPAFTCKASDKTASAGDHTSSSSQGVCSANHVTLSLVQPR